VNGDELVAEVLGSAGGFLELRLFGASRVRLATANVHSITALPGERELLNQSFSEARSEEHQVHHVPGDPRFHTTQEGVIVFASAEPVLIPLPPTEADFRCWFRFRLRVDGSRCGWRWHFADRPPLCVERRAGEWHFIPADGATTRQSMADTGTWQICRLQRIGERFFLSIDERLIAAGPAPPRGPVSLEFFSLPSVQAPAANALVDHLAFVERLADVDEIDPSVSREDAVVGVGGETWWGRVQAIRPGGVEWSDGQTAWRRSWREIHGVFLQPAKEPPAVRTCRGVIVRLELQPSTDRPDIPGGRLTAALGASQGGRVLVDHPLLGRMAIPVAAIRRAERRFAGEWRLLRAGEVRFTDVKQGAASDIRRTEPIDGSFALAEVPNGTAYLSVEAAGLDPAGAQTPPGSPTLARLRTGRLATEVIVNGRRLGSLNELTSQWSLPGKFDQLRLRLPNQVLQRGWNEWRLTHEGRADVRLRNVAIEIEDAWP
jgi:hypothetical protein